MKKCPQCKTAISPDQNFEIVGQAGVVGNTSLRKFHKRGVEWEVHDTDSEEFSCPNCGTDLSVWDFKP